MGSSHIAFIVRQDGGTSDVLFQTSDTTWQAYNRYGGISFYDGSGPGGGLSGAGRAYKVSYNRPFTTRAFDNGQDWVFNAEYPMVRWLEANGYDVSYFDGRGRGPPGRRDRPSQVYLTVGHDEYWSKQQRLNVEKARDGQFPGQTTPVHLVFLSGNEVFWKTRWESSIDGSGTTYRTLVCYKETHEGAKIDPSPEWTGTWRDPRFSPPSDGGNPENGLTGTIFTVNGVQNDSIRVPAADGQDALLAQHAHRRRRSATDQTWTAPAGTLGYEWDEDLDNGFRPAGLVRLSTATVNVAGLLQDYGSTFASGTATHRLTFHKRANGALVFGAGTVQWSWGLDGDHDRGGTATSVDMQQATVNLFADMGAQPATLQAGLLPASASADTTPPVSGITSPANNASVLVGTAVTIQGTAVDGQPGLVGAVEVSVDGGLTWHPATGRDTWSYSWMPAAAGTYSVLSRAVDDSGNIEIARRRTDGRGHDVLGHGLRHEHLGGHGHACDVERLRRSADRARREVPRLHDRQHHEDPVLQGEPGRKRPHGAACGARRERSSVRARLRARRLRAGRRSLFPRPWRSRRTRPTLRSYHANPGYYAATTAYFTAAVTNGPLTALADGTDGPNGLYKYGAIGFPTQSFNKSNYWVDVVFVASGSVPDTTPPTVTATSPASGATGVLVDAAVTATFSEPLAAATVTGTTVQLRDAAAQLVLASATWNAGTVSIVLQPASALSPSTSYTATIKGGTGGVKDVAGNPLAADVSWTFTTGTGAGTSAGWYAGDMHVHRSCGGAPESISSMHDKMATNDLAVISLLADMGNGEVQDATQDLPRVTGADDPASTTGRIVHWDAEWHWDATYTQYPHQALGGHVVALGLNSAQQVWEEYTYPIFQWARQRNGIAGFAHMQYLDDSIPQSLNCCLPLEYPVEVALGSASFISEDVLGSDSAVRAYYRLLNTGFRPGFAAGTDYPCGVSTVGSLLTYVRVAGGQMTYRNWIEGIAAGRTVVSRNGHDEFLGLTVNGTAGPGDEIRLTTGGALSVDVQWTAQRSLAGTIELVQNGNVVAVLAASAAPGAPATLSTTVSFPKSGWLAARRMDANGHQVHTGAVFVIVNNAPIRASVADAQFYVQWMDNLLTRTAVGGAWSSFFTTSRDAARARYQAAKDLFQQIAAEAAAAPPSVTSVTPASGATGVAVTTTVSATFSEPLAPATVNGSTFGLRDGAGNAVSGTVSWNSGTNTAVFQPTSPLATSTTYTATVKGGASGVTDAGGTPMAADFSWTFTTQAGGSGSTTIWAGGGSPASVNEYDGQELELGVKFRSSQDGYVSAIRFYKGNLDTGTHTASLWTSGGTRLATASFVAETSSGWQEVTLPSAVAISANTTYVASYHSTPGYYVVSTNYFTTAVTNGPLTCTRRRDGRRERAVPVRDDRLPDAELQQVELLGGRGVQHRARRPPTRPRPRSSRRRQRTRLPASSWARPSARGSASRSRPRPSRTLASCSATPAASWCPRPSRGTRRHVSAILRPNSALAYSTTYTATVKGGTGGVTDVAGNPLAADYSWTLHHAGRCPRRRPRTGPAGRSS